MYISSEEKGISSEEIAINVQLYPISSEEITINVQKRGISSEETAINVHFFGRKGYFFGRNSNKCTIISHFFGFLRKILP